MNSLPESAEYENAWDRMLKVLYISQKYTHVQLILSIQRNRESFDDISGKNEFEFVNKT